MNTDAPLKPCNHSGCRTLVTGKYCGKHTKDEAAKKKKVQREYDQYRGTRTERGYDNRWLKAARLFRYGKVCVMCENKGIVKMAECVDHIIPHKGDMELFWDMNNWQPACLSCNSEKAAKEEGGFSNPMRTI